MLLCVMVYNCIIYYLDCYLLTNRKVVAAKETINNQTISRTVKTEIKIHCSENIHT